ncbi:MAG: hypothetical protein QMD23_05325 [Candidatus Bathyarchaeia archaeon]|nr:hypothetical protein [Candidatus Bathyarchaeia archaeon]
MFASQVTCIGELPDNEKRSGGRLRSLDAELGYSLQGISYSPPEKRLLRASKTSLVSTPKISADLLINTLMTHE